MISPKSVEAHADLRELVGEEEAQRFSDAHWNERDRGYDAVALEVARLRAAGVGPTFPRWSASRTMVGRVTDTLRGMGLLSREEGDLSDGSGFYIRGGIVHVPEHANEDDVLAGLLQNLAAGDS